MVSFRRWFTVTRLRVVLAVVAAAVVAGGVLLGLDLGGSSNPTSPRTAAGSGTHRTSTTDNEGSNTSTTGTSTSTSAPPVKVPAFCTLASGSEEGTITLQSCSQRQVTGGTGSFPGSVLLRAGTGTVTWNGTGTTTFVFVVAHPASQQRKCPGYYRETTIKGAVVANSPQGPDNVGLKGPVRAKLCVAPNFSVSLMPGRKFQF